MNEDDKNYELPRPNMNVFGGDNAPDRPAARVERPPGSVPGEPSGQAGEGAEQAAEPVTEPVAAQDAGPGPRRPLGSMRFQDASTAPRPPSLAEQRARIAAEEERAARLAEAERVATGRRRVMIGGGVTVGIAALVGAWYLLATPQSVTARCTISGGGTDGTVVTDQYCDPAYASSHGGYVSNGLIFIPFGGGFRQYHYYYGGTGGIGQRVSGGSYTAPSHATVRTGSGTTISRGGFGITGRGGSSGGSGGRSGGTGGSGGIGGHSGGS